MDATIIRTAVLDITQKLFFSRKKIIGISEDATAARSTEKLISEKAIKDYVDTLAGGGISLLVEQIKAGENLAINDLVYLAADAKWYKAGNLIEAHVSTELRIAKEIILTGATGPAYIQGKITTAGLTPGAVYYVGTGGLITSTIPETEGIFQRKIGTALSATELEFLPDQTYIEITLIGEPVSSFSKVFGNVLTDTILEAEHGMTAVHDAKVLNPTTRAEVEVYTEYRADNSVYIEANYSLQDYILKLS